MNGNKNTLRAANFGTFLCWDCGEMAAIKYVKFSLGGANYGIDIRKQSLTGQIRSKPVKHSFMSNVYYV